MVEKISLLETKWAYQQMIQSAQWVCLFMTYYAKYPHLYKDSPVQQAQNRRWLGKVGAGSVLKPLKKATRKKQPLPLGLVVVDLKLN